MWIFHICFIVIIIIIIIIIILIKKPTPTLIWQTESCKRKNLE